jgi:prepilin signal peptidase PulO-like enzyme (type II secretory pathway)
VNDLQNHRDQEAGDSISATLPPEPAIKLWHAITAVALGCVVYCAVIPLFTEWRHGTFQPIYYRTELVERFVEAVIAAWFFALGGCIGSFLNVIVYRMPRGKPITGSSFCPQCQQTIAWYDNIPIFAWLNLKGACRHCKLPISQRYPSVELLVAICFFVLAVVEIGNSGVNLPNFLRYRPGFGVNLTREDPPLAMTFACHAATMAILIVNALIVRDGFQAEETLKFPQRVTLAIGLLVTVAVLFFPAIHSNISEPASAILPRVFPLAKGILAGLAAGVAFFIGTQLEPATPRRGASNETLAVVLGFSLIGLTFGWDAIGQIALLFCYIQLTILLCWSFTHCVCLRPAEILALATFVFLLTWRWLPIPSDIAFTSMVIMISTPVAAGVFTALLRRFERKTVHRVEGADRV